MALSFIDKAIEVVEDLGYNIRKWTTHILGKAGIKGVAGTLGDQLAPLLTGAVPGLSSALGHGAGHTIGTLIATPVAAGFSAALVQGDHLRRRTNLLNEYRDEIGSWLSRQTGETKDHKKLTEQDMDLAAYGDKERGIEGNPVLKEALDQSGKARNWGVAISALSSAASTLVVGGLMNGMLPAFWPLHALAGGAIGFALYLPISIGIHWVAEAMFGLEKFTVNDHIKSIHRTLSRGHEVTPEQVLEPFLQIHPEVDTMIKAAYGRRFEKLDAEKRQDVVGLLAPQIGLEKMVEDINQHRMKPEELAFVLSNQVSGVHLVDMDATAPEGPMAHLWHRFKSVFTRKAQMPAQEKADTVPEYASVAAQSPDGNAQVAVQAYHNPQPDREVSFVRMVGRKQGDDGTRSFAESVGRREVHQSAGSYSEIVEQSRSSTEVQMG